LSCCAVASSSLVNGTDDTAKSDAPVARSARAASSPRPAMYTGWRLPRAPAWAASFSSWRTVYSGQDSPPPSNDVGSVVAPDGRAGIQLRAVSTTSAPARDRTRGRFTIAPGVAGGSGCDAGRARPPRRGQRRRRRPGRRRFRCDRVARSTGRAPPPGRRPPRGRPTPSRTSPAPGIPPAADDDPAAGIGVIDPPPPPPEAPPPPVPPGPAVPPPDGSPPP